MFMCEIPGLEEIQTFSMLILPSVKGIHLDCNKSFTIQHKT